MALAGHSPTAGVARTIPRSGSKNSNASPASATAATGALTGTKPTNASPGSSAVPLQDVVILRRAFFARRRTYAIRLRHPWIRRRNKGLWRRCARKRSSPHHPTPVPLGTAFISPGRKSGVSPKKGTESPGGTATCSTKPCHPEEGVPRPTKDQCNSPTPANTGCPSFAYFAKGGNPTSPRPRNLDAEKNAVYQEFELPALSEKVNGRQRKRISRIRLDPAQRIVCRASKPSIGWYPRGPLPH